MDEGDLVGKILQQGSSKSAQNVIQFESETEEVDVPVDKVSKKSKSKSMEEVKLEPSKIKEIVDRVTSNITGTLQTLVVSDRVLAAERNSNEWKRLCHLMVNNPEIINDRMLMTDSPTKALKHFGPDFADPAKVCCVVFCNHTDQEQFRLQWINS